METMHLGRRVKLGRAASNPEDLVVIPKLAHYLHTAAFGEFVPPVFDWFQGVPDYMDANDRLGDCVVAAQAKMDRSWTQNATGVACTISEADIVNEYKQGAGYNPADPSTDQGWDLPTALKYWKTIGMVGHKIAAYAAVNPKHHAMMRAGCYIFGGLYIALELPITAQDQTVWDVVSKTGDGTPGSWGGHCVTIQGFDYQNRALIRTWGSSQLATWDFLDAYCDEAYVVLTPDYFRNGRTVAGLDLPKLQADLALVTA